MSNKDINKQDAQKIINDQNLSIKENMHLFSFSLLKSKSKISLSQNCNSFNIDFSKDNNDLNYNKKNKEYTEKINNRKISLIDGDNNSSLKTLNIEVPSSELLSNEKFKNEFMIEYDNSFANYCGINKKQFNDIYVKNRYIPILDVFGDININIKYIVDLLKTYSLNVKAGRKIIKRNRIKKIFKTLKKKTHIEKSKKNRLLFEVKKNEVIKKTNTKEHIKDINDTKIKEINPRQKIENLQINNKIEDKKENYNNNILNSGIGINDIKNKILLKNGNIPIPNKHQNQNQKILLNKPSIGPINTSSLGLGSMTKSILGNNNFNFPYNSLSNEGNKQLLTNNININNNPPTSFGLGYSAIQQISPSNNNNNNNNYFNFSSKTIQNYNYGNPMHAQNNINNNILSNNTNTLSYNKLLNNQILSPKFNNLLVSPRIFTNDLLSPPILANSNLSTPRPISPGINNNLFTDIFTYNNINPNFFFGNTSTTPLKNNINNNIINNNIINNKKINENKSDILFNNNIMNNNGINNNKNIIENNNMNGNARKNIKKNLKINLNMN